MAGFGLDDEFKFVTNAFVVADFFDGVELEGTKRNDKVFVADFFGNLIEANQAGEFGT